VRRPPVASENLTYERIVSHNLNFLLEFANLGVYAVRDQISVCTYTQTPDTENHVWRSGGAINPWFEIVPLCNAGEKKGERGQHGSKGEWYETGGKGLIIAH